MYLKSLFSILAVLLIVGCGEGKVTVDPQQYEEKIAIEGFLFPQHPVEKIYITRNFRVDHNLRTLDINLPDAIVTITDIQTGSAYQLTYNSQESYFFYSGNDLVIDYGKSYRLEVSASIDGREVQASSTTTVPQAALTAIGVNYDSLFYYQRDANGNLIFFDVEFNRSTGLDFYLATITALNADTANFIYDNAFDDPDPEEVLVDLEDYRFSYEWVQNTPLTPGISNIEIFWFYLWFYTDYQIVIYGVDKNYRDFLRTYNDVKEIDGNFHEPVFHIEGDGIGVFGSAVTDTVMLKVIR